MTQRRAATRADDPSARAVQVAQQVAHLETLRAANRTLAHVAGVSPFYGRGDHSLTGRGEPERLTAVQVTEQFFPLLGVRPAVGRLFTAEESRYGGPGAVVLSHALWVRRFAADPGVVGRPVTLDGVPVTVVGVLTAAFDFGAVFAPGTRVDYFAPFPLSPETTARATR